MVIQFVTILSKSWSLNINATLIRVNLAWNVFIVFIIKWDGEIVRNVIKICFDVDHKSVDCCHLT